MSMDTPLADRVRALILADTHQVEEKKMFGSLVFLVNDKLCVGVNPDRILVRLDPDRFAAFVESGELEPMKMGSRTSSSFGYVALDQIRTTKALQRWVNYALEFNRLVPDAPKKKRKK